MYSSTYDQDQNYKRLGAFTPDKNLPRSPERELCFVLHLLGNKIRETKMFNNMLPVSAVFHSCGRLCPQRRTADENASPYNTPHWLAHAEEKSSTGAQRFVVWDHNVIFSRRSCRKALRAVKPALKLLHAQAGKRGCVWKTQHKAYASFRSGVAPPSTA